MATPAVAPPLALDLATPSLPLAVPAPKISPNNPAAAAVVGLQLPPTPNSLPSATIARRARSPSREGSVSLQSRRESSEEQDLDQERMEEGRAGEMQFHLSSDEEDESLSVTEGSGRTHRIGRNQSSGAAPATADTSLHFSSNIAIQRPFRSRYSHQPYDRSSSPAASASTSSLLAEPSAAPKRSFSEVTPSSGSTPPAIPSAFSVSFASTSTGMHSFDSQRFSSSSSSSSATRTRYLREQQEAGGLRRRNLPSTAEGGVNEGERERAKRRRAGTLELRPRDEPPPISPSSPRSPRMRDAQEDEDGWNWPSEERDRERRATSTSFQLAPVVGVGSTSSVSRRITRTESNESSRRNLLESLPSPPLLPIPFAELPSTRDLPHPSAQVERPVIGFNRPTPSPASPPSSGSSSFSFLLTNLRSRHADRPRLARNALGAISPPEEVERRLWGSLDDEEEGRRRMRGPTERANERWRMGQLPPAEEPTTSTTTTRRRRPAPTSLFNPLPGSAAEGLGQPLRPSALQPSLESGGPVHDLSLPLPFPSTSDRIRIARPTPLVRPPTQAQNPLMPESDSEEEQETGDESREAAQSARAWREMHRDITAGVRTVGGGDEGQMPQRQPPTSRLFRRHQQLPRPTTALNDSPPSPPSPPVRERSSIAEALALFRATTSSSSDESTLRRRRSPATLASPVEPQEETTPATERHAARTERLQSLRRERNLVRALLGGVVPPVEQEQEEHQQPRSPGGRTRGLSEFFRGMGGVGGRFVAAWDEDFAGFYRRDSAALDPRNYLDDDEFDSSYDALLRLSEQLGDVKPKGVSQDKVEKMLTFRYDEWPMPLRPPPQPTMAVASTSAVTMDEDLPAFARKGLEKEERCAVCLQDYEDDDLCMLGHCHHGFHADCFRAWLKEHSACPLCRKDYSVIEE